MRLVPLWPGIDCGGRLASRPSCLSASYSTLTGKELRSAWRGVAIRVRTLTLGILPALVLLAGPASVQADIVIAVATPLSGPREAEGRAMTQAAQWAVDEINAAGGAAGEPLSVIAVDDGCDAERGRAAAQSLVVRKPAVVIGHPCAAAAIAGAKIYAAEGIVFIAAAPRHPQLTKPRAGPTIFRLAGRDDQQGPAAGRYLASAYAGRRVAIIHDRTRYARDLADGVRAAFVAAAVAIHGEFGIVAGDKDFSATIQAVQLQKVDAVFFAGFPTEAEALLNQMARAGFHPEVIAGDAVATTGMAGQRLRVVLPWTAIDAQGAGPLLARLSAAGYERSAAAVTAYAAIQAWNNAALTAGTPAQSAVAQSLHATPADTIVGSVRFDPNGDAVVAAYAVARREGTTWRHEAVIAPARDLEVLGPRRPDPKPPTLPRGPNPTHR